MLINGAFTNSTDQRRIANRAIAVDEQGRLLISPTSLEKIAVGSSSSSVDLTGIISALQTLNTSVLTDREVSERVVEDSSGQVVVIRTLFTSSSNTPIISLLNLDGTSFTGVLVPPLNINLNMQGTINSAKNEIKSILGNSLDGNDTVISLLRGILQAVISQQTANVISKTKLANNTLPFVLATDTADQATLKTLYVTNNTGSVTAHYVGIVAGINPSIGANLLYRFWNSGVANETILVDSNYFGSNLFNGFSVVRSTNPTTYVPLTSLGRNVLTVIGYN